MRTARRKPDRFRTRPTQAVNIVARPAIQDLANVLGRFDPTGKHADPWRGDAVPTGW
jgi:hypothetical protein